MRLELYRSIIEHILSQVWTDTIVRFKLNHRKTFLCISNCLLEQPDTWASNQGAMIESIFKTSCEIIESGWDKDRAPVDTFIMGLASSIRERNDYEEQVTLVLAPNVEKIILPCLLAGLSTFVMFHCYFTFPLSLIIWCPG